MGDSNHTPSRVMFNILQYCGELFNPLPEISGHIFPHRCRGNSGSSSSPVRIYFHDLNGTARDSEYPHGVVRPAHAPRSRPQGASRQSRDRGFGGRCGPGRQGLRTRQPRRPHRRRHAGSAHRAHQRHRDRGGPGRRRRTRSLPRGHSRLGREQGGRRARADHRRDTPRWTRERNFHCPNPRDRS